MRLDHTIITLEPNCLIIVEVPKVKVVRDD